MSRRAELFRDRDGRILVRFPFTEERPTMGKVAGSAYAALWRTLRTLSDHEQRVVLLQLCSAHVQQGENRILQSWQQTWVKWNGNGWRYLLDDRRDPSGTWGRIGVLPLGPDATDDDLRQALQQREPTFEGTLHRGWPEIER